MLVGARIIKTGIAVIFAIYLSQWFHLDSGIGYIVASSVLAIQPSVYRSWRQLIENIEANLVGATLVIAGIALFGNHPAVIGLIIILVIAINLRLHLERSLDLSIFVVIALAYSSGDHYVVYALHRFLFIMLGISFATIINMFLLPPNHQRRVMQGVHEMRDRLSLLLRLGSTKEIKELHKSRIAVEQDFDKLLAVYKLYREERPVLKRRVPLSQLRAKVLVRKMMETLLAEMRVLEAIEKLKGPCPDFTQHIIGVMAYHEKLLNVHAGLVTMPSEEVLEDLMEKNSMLADPGLDEAIVYAAWQTRNLLWHLKSLANIIKVMQA